MPYALAMREAFASGESVTAKIVSTLSRQPKAPMLEFAAGTGILKGCTDERRNLVLVEHDPDAVEAMGHLSFRGNMECLHHAPWKVERPDESIGTAIIAQNAIWRLRPSSFCFSEAHRLLSPGGRLYTVLDDVGASEEDASVQAWNASSGSYAMEEVLYTGSPDPVLVTSVRPACSSPLQQYDFVRPVPPTDRVMRVMRGLGFDVAEPVRLESGRGPESKGRPVALVGATKGSSAPSVKYMKARDTYDEIAGTYDDFVGGSEYRVPAWLIDEIGRKYGCDGRSVSRLVLDLGCGNGYLGKRLVDAKAMNARFFGCDLSRQMVEQCADSGAYEAALTYDLNRGVPIVESRFFDVVLACGFIEFLESCKELIGGMHRVLRPGGSAFVTFEWTRTSSRPVEVSEGTVPRTLEARAYSMEEVEALLTAQGLAIRSLHTGIGYRSPTTGRDVPYIFVHAEKGR